MIAILAEYHHLHTSQGKYGMRLRHYIDLVESRIADPVIGDEQAVIDAAVSSITHEVNYGGEDGPKWTWRIDNDKDPYGDDEDDANGSFEGDDWDRHVEDWAHDRVDEARFNIEGCFKGDMIRIWRVITAPQNWHANEKHPGIYWSWKENAAEAHWGDFSADMVTWKLEAEVHHNQIDWVPTLVQNSLSSYETEKEIRLKKDTPVKLLSAKIVE